MQGRFIAVVAGVVGVLSAACVTTPKWQAATTMPEERFPSRAEVKKLLERPPKLDVAKFSAEPIDSWDLQGPFPESATASYVSPTSVWEKQLVAVAPRFAQALTEDHRCLARETARFLAARKDYPGHSLRRFIELRCGTTARHVTFSSVTGTVPKNVNDAEWFAQWKDEVVKLAKLEQYDLAGIAAAREADHAVLIVALGEAGAVFNAPVPLMGADLKTVELKGRLARGGAFRIDAIINQGTLGTAECKTLGAASPPEFAFSCNLAPGDTRAVVEIAAYDEGRILGRKVVDLAVYPIAEPPKRWSRAKGSVDVPAGLFAARFLAEVNAFRTRSGLSALTEAVAQSQTATGLVPHYFAASFGQAESTDGDLIALAMLAGWDVSSGTDAIDIISSAFGNDWLSGTRDVGLFLELLLDSPYQRKALTDPRATRIAIGAIDEPGAVAAIFATYVPLPKFDRKDAEVALITRLNTLRLERMLPLAQWTLWPQDEGALIERNLLTRSWTPMDASRHAMRATAAVAKGEVRGYVQIVDDLEHFQFPPEVLMRKDINVFLAVATYKGEDWAQTRYVVSFVLASKGDIETASRELGSTSAWGVWAR